MTEPARTTRRRLARRACLALTILALAGLVVALARLEIDRTPTPEAGALNLRQMWPVWITSGAAWLGLTGVALTLVRERRRATRDGGARRPALLLAVAVAARIVVLIAHEPALSDDLYRYVLDGRTLAAGVNPYLDTPAERVAALAQDPAAQRFAGEADLLPLVNNPEMHTIYLPTSQWVFGAIAAVLPEAWSSPAASARTFRAAFVAVEMLVIWMLLVAARRARRPAWWVALYAWHPLAITEIAGSGHQDVLGIALLVAAMLLWGSRRRRLFRWTIPLALGALVKPVVVPAAAIMLRGRPLRVWMRCALLGAITCVAVAGPLWFTQGGQPLKNLGETASRFSRKWAHFGSVYEPVLWTIERATNDPDEWRRDPGDEELWSNDEQEILARAICLVLVGGVILVLLGTKVDAWSAGRVLLFAMVLFSSTAHPWYLLWALAMMPRAPSAAAWLATLTLPWGYAQLGDVVEWHTPAGVMLLAYVPVYAVLVVDLARTVLRGRGRREPPFE